jgi:hypothetical protein
VRLDFTSISLNSRWFLSRSTSESICRYYADNDRVALGFGQPTNQHDFDAKYSHFEIKLYRETFVDFAI